jgi:hypothetical protein
MNTYQPVAVSESIEPVKDIPRTEVKETTDEDIDVQPAESERASVKIPPTPRITLEKPKKSKRKGISSYFNSDTWTWEILSCVIAILTIVLTCVLLNQYNGHPAPVVLRHHVALGSVISIFATIIKTTLSISLSASIGQLLWLKLRRGHRPLHDIALYDDASRGMKGGVILLWNKRGRLVFLFK